MAEASWPRFTAWAWRPFPLVLVLLDPVADGFRNLPQVRRVVFDDLGRGLVPRQVLAAEVLLERGEDVALKDRGAPALAGEACGLGDDRGQDGVEVEDELGDGVFLRPYAGGAVDVLGDDGRP